MERPFIKSIPFYSSGIEGVARGGVSSILAGRASVSEKPPPALPPETLGRPQAARRPAGLLSGVVVVRRQEDPAAERPGLRTRRRPFVVVRLARAAPERPGRSHPGHPPARAGPGPEGSADPGHRLRDRVDALLAGAEGLPRHRRVRRPAQRRPGREGDRRAGGGPDAALARRRIRAAAGGGVRPDPAAALGPFR